MTTQLSPTPIFKAFDNVGLPLSFGLLYTYQAGTTTPQATYTDSTGNTPNPNPVLLNARGEAQIWLNPLQNYKFLLTDAGGNQIPGWPVDNISGSLYPGQSIIPNTDNAFDIGSLGDRWHNGYFGTQIFVGSNNAPIVDSSGNVGYWARTAAEIAAGVTPVNFAYDPGDVRRYGAIGNGTTDDSGAFASAALVSGTHSMMIPYTAGGYKIVTPFALPANGTMIGFGRPQLFATINGTHIVSATSVATVTIQDVRFLGTSASTVPLTGFGGFAAANTGLVCITNCTDVRILNCECSTFYNPITVQGCTRVWIENSIATTFLNTGILASRSKYVFIDDNDIENCTQAGGVVAYGIQVTGDAAGGNPCTDISITNNRINGIPSWDAIGTHDCDGLIVIGNKCRNVRHGIDVGHLVSTNVCNNILIADNYVEGTLTDTWSGAAAEIGGVIVEGFDASHRVSGVTIRGNLIRNFFDVNGMVGGGNGAGCICVTNADDANVNGNVIAGGGTGNTPEATGIFIEGSLNRLSIVGNSIQGGSYVRGGIRFQNVLADVVTIQGNSGIQSTTANNHIILTGSTVSLASIGNNPSNSTQPYLQDVTTTVGTSSGAQEGSFTGTLTGCSGTAPTGTVQWSVSEGICTLTFPDITGTSNANTCTLTGLPAQLQPRSSTSTVRIAFSDNSAYVSDCAAQIASGSGTVTFLKSGTAGGFTTSGTKGVRQSTIAFPLN